jgi:hypothetical protein
MQFISNILEAATQPLKSSVGRLIAIGMPFTQKVKLLIALHDNRTKIMHSSSFGDGSNGGSLAESFT